MKKLFLGIVIGYTVGIAVAYSPEIMNFLKELKEEWHKEYQRRMQ